MRRILYGQQSHLNAYMLKKNVRENSPWQQEHLQADRLQGAREREHSKVPIIGLKLLLCCFRILLVSWKSIKWSWVEPFEINAKTEYFALDIKRCRFFNT